jgi:DNA-binding CsgD family transcriptional regulator
VDDLSDRGHSAALLALVTRALASVNAGVDPRPLICADLDVLVGSDSSTYVMRGLSGELQLASSDGGGTDLDLVERAVRLVGSDQRPVRFVLHGCAGDAGLAGACLPLMASPARTSALVLSGHVPDCSVLEEAGPALREVDGLIARLDPARPVVRDQRRGSAVPLLTTRELEVLRLLAEGLLARTIAVRLELSPRTVHHHLGRIYDKLGVCDRLAAVLRAREQGLLSDRIRTAPGSPRPRAGVSPGRWW